MARTARRPSVARSRACSAMRRIPTGPNASRPASRARTRRPRMAGRGLARSWGSARRASWPCAPSQARTAPSRSAAATPACSATRRTLATLPVALNATGALTPRTRRPETGAARLWATARPAPSPGSPRCARRLTARAWRSLAAARLASSASCRTRSTASAGTRAPRAGAARRRGRVRRRRRSPRRRRRGRSPTGWPTSAPGRARTACRRSAAPTPARAASRRTPPSPLARAPAHLAQTCTTTTPRSGAARPMACTRPAASRIPGRRARRWRSGWTTTVPRPTPRTAASPSAARTSAGSATKRTTAGPPA
mmetsp:Transcript_82519/g.212605  ORF Transcript_82519/g.212605 Transcript_82519/m.212605 type:complete len:310 (-) Transcript_82519:985-1914(-)